MSTLLTPIVTQLELDRDRFKTLVNGTEIETVSLEGRTEKSIAGQVNDRIDTAASNFLIARDTAVQAATDAETAKTATETLKNDVQTLKSDTSSFKVTAEGARDQTLSTKANVDQVYTDTVALKSDTQLLHDNTLTYKNTAVSARNSAETAENNAASFASAASASANNADSFAANASTSATNAQSAATNALNDADRAETAANGIVGTITTRLAKPPIQIFPRDTATIEPGTIPFIISFPIFYGNAAKWDKRTIEVEEFDGTNWIAFETYETTELNFVTPPNGTVTNEFPENGTFRYRVKDQFIPVEGNSAIYSSEWTAYNEFTTTATGSGDTPATAPSITTTEGVDEIILDASSYTGTISDVYWVIYESSTTKLEYIANLADSTGLVVSFPYDRMIQGATYKAYVRVFDNQNDGDPSTDVITEWSSPVSIQKPSSTGYSVDLTGLKSLPSYGSIDANTAKEFIFDNTQTSDDVTINITNMTPSPRWITIKGNAGTVNFDAQFTQYNTISLGATFTQIRIENTVDGLYLIQELSV